MLVCDMETRKESETEMGNMRSYRRESMPTMADARIKNSMETESDEQSGTDREATDGRVSISSTQPASSQLQPKCTHPRRHAAKDQARPVVIGGKEAQQDGEGVPPMLLAGKWLEVEVQTLTLRIGHRGEVQLHPDFTRST